MGHWARSGGGGDGGGDGAAAATGSVGAAAAAPGEAAGVRGAAAPAEAEAVRGGRIVGLMEVNNGNTFRRRPTGQCTGWARDDAGAHGRGLRCGVSLEWIGSPTAARKTARSARAAAAVDTPA